ncbi:MAG: MBL fold metallo-hydrolase [Bacilli bacterium]|nr:MBL fold metallo-hydrolase [Bacilli bacterium]MDD4795476.1 MBL fold metallo-hydrolase [Bacilli bacterium]
MEVVVLASGSKGNSTLIKTKEHKILVDAGMSVKYLEDKLRLAEVLIKDIDYIFITHTHNDHVKALNNLIKKYNPKIVLTEKMYADLKFLKNYEHIIMLEENITLGNLVVESIPTSHDTSDSRGYCFTEDDDSVVIITDTGYLNRKYFKKISNKKIYIFESNHDIEMLQNGKYPGWLKNRVYGPIGHLSNKEASFYLSKIIGPNTKQIILAHLSEENNSPEIAIENIKNYFIQKNIVFTNIVAAKQFEITESTML